MALAVAIYMVGFVSGGHFNPVVTIIMVLNKSLKIEEAFPYILSQVLGGLLALTFSNAIQKY